MDIDVFFKKAKGSKPENVWEYLDSKPELWLTWYPDGGFAPQPGTGSWNMKVFFDNLQRIEGADNETKSKYGKRRAAHGHTNTPEDNRKKPRKTERRGWLI